MLATVTAHGRNSGGPSTVSGRLLGQLAQQSMPRLGIGIGVVALAVSGLFGGLQEATEPAAKPVAVGEVADGGPWKVTVTRARLVNDLKPMVLKDKGNRWIVVIAKVATEEATVEPHVGGRYELGWDHGPVKILELEPDRVVAYSWRYPDHPDTIVRWELEGSGSRTHLTVVHSGFVDSSLAEEYRGGWPGFLVSLKRLH